MHLLRVPQSVRLDPNPRRMDRKEEQALEGAWLAGWWLCVRGQVTLKCRNEGPTLRTTWT